MLVPFVNRFSKRPRSARYPRCSVRRGTNKSKHVESYYEIFRWYRDYFKGWCGVDTEKVTYTYKGGKLFSIKSSLQNKDNRKCKNYRISILQRRYDYNTERPIKAHYDFVTEWDSIDSDKFNEYINELQQRTMLGLGRRAK